MKINIIILLSLWTISLLGNEQQATISEENFQKIYEHTLNNSKVDKERESSHLTFEFLGSTAQLSDAKFNNNYYLLPYSTADSKSIVALHLGSFFNLLRVGDFSFDPGIEVQYSYNESIVTAESVTNSNNSYKDVIKLQWVPIMTGLRASCTLPFLRQVSVFAKPGIGMQWVNLEGSLDGINQDHWIPFWYIGGGINAFSQEEKNPNHWFGGITASGGTIHTLDNQMTFNTPTFDLGLRFIL